MPEATLPSSQHDTGVGLMLPGEPPMSTTTAARVAARKQLPVGQRFAIHMEIVKRKGGRPAKEMKRQVRLKK